MSSAPVQATEADPLVSNGKRGSGVYGLFGFVDWWVTLLNNFGGVLLVLLFFTQHLLKGFVMSLTSRAQPYVYREYKVPAPQMQIFKGVTMLPWAMKPVIGLISDVFPIGGYNKAPYFLMAAVMGTAAYLAIGLKLMPVTVMVTCLFATQVQLSTSDLLSEAKYAEKMQNKPEHGPALLTYVWSGMTLAGLVAVLASGPVIRNWGAKSAYLLSAVPAFGALLVVSRGYLEEKKLNSEEVAKVQTRFLQQQEACILCFMMLVGSICIIATGLAFSNVMLNCVVSMVVFIAMLVSFSVMLSPAIARFNAFSLIQTSLSWSVGGAAYYFYTDTKEQYEAGPHFSEFFYNSVLGSFASVLSLVGIITYQRYLSEWSYRSLLVVANVALSIFSLLDIMLFTRTNVDIGIPDTLFVLGTTLFEEIILQWQWMPQVVILSYLCPKGMEATMYSLLAGCHNLGNTVASNCGALLLHQLGVAPSGAEKEDEQFDNLWKAVAVSTVLPLLSILCLFWLIPDVKQSERILDDDDRDNGATKGSVWRRWRGIDD